MKRFWEKVDVRGADECWEWKRGRSDDGYGSFCINGRMKRAHRVSFELRYGAIPDGKHVLHRCDNPKCVNPSHLFLGTNIDNIADKVRKGRSMRGERNPRAKVSNAVVAQIKKDFANGVMQKDIATRFGLSTVHVSQICTGKIRAQ